MIRLISTIVDILLVTLFLTSSAYAFSGTVTLTYSEPISNVNGTALDNLDHITIYYFSNNVPIKAIDIPATKSTGGGTNLTATVPFTVADNIVNVSFFATAINSGGVESYRSAVVKKPVIKP